jgi:hypothetical protein
VAAAQSVGLPFNPDFNAESQLGVVHAQLTIGTFHLLFII